jgi:hypothetical protein
MGPVGRRYDMQQHYTEGGLVFGRRHWGVLMFGNTTTLKKKSMYRLIIITTTFTIMIVIITITMVAG